MTEEIVSYGVLSLIPAILAVVLAFWTKNVIISLMASLFVGCLITAGWNPWNAMQVMFSDHLFVDMTGSSNAQTIIMMSFVGGFVALIEATGGAKAFAAAMDIDAAGLPFLKNLTPPAGSKNVEELAEIIRAAGVPFIVKGVMTVKGAQKAKKAGAAAIVVSNHGGRVLDQCPATAEVLPEIAEAVGGGSMKILVDGGIRNGSDVFKALALGADGVLICRPFVTAVYGGAEEGVAELITRIGGQLKDTMAMCGAHSLSEITRDMVRKF